MYIYVVLFYYKYVYLQYWLLQVLWILTDLPQEVQNLFKFILFLIQVYIGYVFFLISIDILVPIVFGIQKRLKTWIISLSIVLLVACIKVGPSFVSNQHSEQITNM